MKWIDVVAAALRLICFPRGDGCRLTTFSTVYMLGDAAHPRLSHTCTGTSGCDSGLED